MERTVKVNPIGKCGAQVMVSVCRDTEDAEEIVLELLVNWDLYTQKKKAASVAEAIKSLKTLPADEGKRLLENMLTGGVESVWRGLEEIYASAKP